MLRRLGKPGPAARGGSNPFVSFEYPNSLFGEILDWMLAPLLLLWPISIAATNHVASFLANQPYDQHLADNVTAIVKLVKIDGGLGAHRTAHGRDRPALLSGGGAQHARRAR